MKVLVLSFLLACASAQFLPYGAYGGYYGWPTYHGSRYQSQDAFGQASYGYAYPGQAANNFQDAAGNQIGSYAYVNPAGKEVRVSYVADGLGFRVFSNDLPVAVQDTPEVAAAKIELARLQKAAPGASRTKRQAVAVLPTKQFIEDLHYRSVDLNQDGQPDVPVYPAYRYALPYTMPYTLPYATPYTLPYTMPWAAPATPVVAEKSSRKKRQIMPVLPTKQFIDDLHYRSVDLNQDGQPDVPVYPAMHYSLPYTLPAVAPTVKYVAPAPLVGKSFGVTPFPYHTAPYHLW